MNLPAPDQRQVGASASSLQTVAYLRICQAALAETVFLSARGSVSDRVCSAASRGGQRLIRWRGRRRCVSVQSSSKNAGNQRVKLRLVDEQRDVNVGHGGDRRVSGDHRSPHLCVCRGNHLTPPLPSRTAGVGCDGSVMAVAMRALMASMASPLCGSRPRARMVSAACA